MKALKLLSAAALATACAGSAFGAVTSQNIVGYIKLSLNKGYNLVANQLNASPDNAVHTVLNSLPADGVTTVYKWLGHSYSVDGYAAPGGPDNWDDGTETVNPGDGFFVYLGGATTLTLVGEVSLNTSVNIANGYSLVSSPIPVEGDLTDTATINFPLTPGDTFFTWLGTSYNVNGYASTPDGNPSDDWDAGAPPHLTVGQGFFVQSSTARTWTRTFSVQ